MAVGGGDELGAGLGARVGIVAAEWVGLAVAERGVGRGVGLVGGDDEDRANAIARADGLEQVDGALGGRVGSWPPIV